ncbi:MAG: dithiol-disulfide isomerase [Desulfobacula sp. GWF2_41_7]|nr:MAG: dithiol-disulfide isomerase [Desulfobacula sp. GWF2_41_7]
MAQMKATAAGLGLELGDRKMTYNSRLAQEAGLWAETKGKGHQFHMEAFRTYFVHGENIADKAVLLGMIKRSGLDPKEGEAVIDKRLFSKAVDLDWDLAEKSGIIAVPTFRMGQDKIVGAKPYETLKKMVEKYAE